MLKVSNLHAEINGKEILKGKIILMQLILPSRNVKNQLIYIITYTIC